MKTLIVYFSKSGRTRKAAEEIASLLEGADLFEIKVDKTYPPRRPPCPRQRPPRNRANRPSPRPRS